MTKRQRSDAYITNCITSQVERCYIYLLVLTGTGFFFTMLISVGYLIHHAANEEREAGYIDNDIYWLFGIDVLLLISCFDIFCCPFCNERLKLCCATRCNALCKKQRQNRRSTLKEYNQRSNYDTTLQTKLLATNDFEPPNATKNDVLGESEDDKL